MVRIDIKELNNNIDKYIKLGRVEEIEVTQNDKVIFTIIPESIKLTKKWESFFDTLPLSALDDSDISRE